MTLPEPLQKRLSSLSEKFCTCVDRLNELQKKMLDEEYLRVRDEDFIGIFRETCALVREAEAADVPYLQELLDAAQDVFNQGIGIAYGTEPDIFDFMPSWAHNDEDGRPLIQDHGEPGIEFRLSHGSASMMLNSLRLVGVAKDKLPKMCPDPWNDSMKRHPKSNLLARFRPNLPTLTATPTNRIAMSVYDARCEIVSTNINPPTKLQLTKDGSYLFLLGPSGYKDRSPGLDYFLVDEDLKNGGEPHRRIFEPGLTSVAYDMAVDDECRLVFVGDEDRVKSYAWGTPNGYNNELPPIHTLNSQDFSGPMAVLPNGTIVRADQGKVAVWDINGLETHRDAGDKLIGEEIDIEYVWRDDYYNIELSSGTSPSSTIDFIDHPNFKPSVWQPLVGAPSKLLCAEAARQTYNYGCIAIDLEHGGKTIAHYLGHGGSVADVSTSPVDSHVFLTSSHDGFSRLYDVRQSLPVLTLDACGKDSFCESAVLAHPDGIPTAFTGTGSQEQIKAWDIRARALVYELGTGNNTVDSLLWDSKNNCLYAATKCSYIDRLGYRSGYRHMKLPRRENKQDTMELDEDYDSEDELHYWPERAWHSENYFGYMLDAGDHRLYRYMFKENPNPAIMPPYGEAQLGYGYCQ